MSIRNRRLTASKYLPASKPDRQQWLEGAPGQGLAAQSLDAGRLRTSLGRLEDILGLERFLMPQPTAPHAVAAVPASTEVGGYSPLTRLERVVRQLDAEAKNDRIALQLVEHATPYRLYRLRDTILPTQLLHVLTLIYVTEQLESAATVTNALFCAMLEDDDDGSWELIGRAEAYRFRIRREGWLQFTQGLGLDADYLVRSNYSGRMLDLYGEAICNLAPSADELQAMFAKIDGPAPKTITIEDEVQSWRTAFLAIFKSDQIQGSP